MQPIFIVVNEQRQQAGEKLRYQTHRHLAGAAAEAIRLSKKQPEDRFLVLEAKPVGAVLNGETETLA
jgi:hypothetical protein